MGAPSGWSDSFGCALGVAGYIGSRLGSFGCALEVIRFIWVCPGGPSVHSESLRSFGCALGVVGFIQGRWFYSGAPWRSLGSLGVVGLIQVRPSDDWVHSVFARFTRVRPGIVFGFI